MLDDGRMRGRADLLRAVAVLLALGLGLLALLVDLVFDSSVPAAVAVPLATIGLVPAFFLIYLAWAVAYAGVTSRRPLGADRVHGIVVLLTRRL